MNLNKVILTGHMTNDPKSWNQDTPEKASTRFDIAINSPYKDREGVKQERTLFLPVVVFNGKGLNVAKFTKKGSHVLVEGQLRLNSYTTKEGEQRTKLEVNADSVIFLDKKPADSAPADTVDTSEVPFD